jgi:broad specificity phosphatase PhoE
MPKLLLIRAADTEWEEEDRIRGDFDIPLSADGRAELDARLKEVAHYNFTHCYCGTDQPAHETGRAVADHTGAKLRHLPGLRAVHLGTWQGLLRSDVRRKHRRVWSQWTENPQRVRPAGGESLHEVEVRVDAALRDVERRHKPGEVVALVCSPLVGAVAQCIVESVTLSRSLLVQEASPALQLLGEQPGGTPGRQPDWTPEPPAPTSTTGLPSTPPPSLGQNGGSP